MSMVGEMWEDIYGELEKKYEELKAQIEKMKCCGNCSKSCFAQDCEDIVNRCGYATSDSLLFKCGRWELAE